MEIQQKIKGRRLELNLTLKDVAKALGVSEATISRYETGDIQNMGIDKMKALSSVLRCSPGFLMGWQQEKESADGKEEARLVKKYSKLSDANKKAVLTLIDNLLSAQSQ